MHRGFFKNLKNLFFSFFRSYFDKLIHKISTFLFTLFSFVYGILRWNNVDYAFIMGLVAIVILVAPMISHLRFRPFNIKVKMTPMVPDSSSDGFFVDHDSKDNDVLRFEQGKVRADMNFILYCSLERLCMKFDVPNSIEFNPLDRPPNSKYDRENRKLRFESFVPSDFQFVVDLESDSTPFSATQSLEIYDCINNKKIIRFELKT